MKRKLTVACTAVATLVLVAALAGCGGGGSGSSSSGMKTIKLGVFPSGSLAPVYLAADKGIFAKHGLKVEFDTQNGGAALMPALNSGQLDFAFGSPISVLTARAQGLDVHIATGFNAEGPVSDMGADSSVVVAMPASGIKTTADLAGRRVSVNALGAAGELGIREAVKKAGKDPNSIKFVELGFQDVAAQLKSGAIDAGMVVPPFTQELEQDGAKVISDFQREAGISDAVLVTYSGSAAAKDPKELADFQAAMKDVVTYGTEHPEEVRQEMVKQFDFSPTLAKTIPLGKLTTQVPEQALQNFARLLYEYKVLPKEPDVAGVVLN